MNERLERRTKLIYIRTNGVRNNINLFINAVFFVLFLKLHVQLFKYRCEFVLFLIFIGLAMFDCRNCIGQNFAMSEERTVLATLLQRYVINIQRSQPYCMYQ